MQFTIYNLQFTKQKGMSLLEVLIVLAVFAILGILIARTITLTIQGSKKGAAIVHARENLDYSLSIMERQIRNATSVAPCPNTDASKIDYVDQYGASSTFTCANAGSDDSYIASGSARLTNNNVAVVSCSFVCSVGDANNPDSVTIDLSVKDASISGITGANVSASTKIYLRNY